MNRSIVVLTVMLAATAGAQGVTRPDSAAPQRGRGGQWGGGPPWRTAADTARAHRLYVSADPQDMPRTNPGTAGRVRTDSIFKALAAGVMEFRTITYKSDVDTMIVPGYVFAPRQKRAGGHAAIVWVHGFVHGRLEERHWPFIKEAVDRGYVVVAPQYRGSTGYTAEWADAIDYGGKEIDDVRSAYTFIKDSLPYVDRNRVGIMGWSHGGFITAHNLFRADNPFKAGAPIVPVTNLIFRLGTHSPSYAQPFASRPEIHGMPFENMEEYIRRSPVFQAEGLKVPILVHVATNDCDVHFVENQQMVYTLRALHPTLADTKIYKDPPYLLRDKTDGRVPGQGADLLGGCGHYFSERVDVDPTSPTYLKRLDSPEQIDAWNRIWAFFEKNLKPTGK